MRSGTGLLAATREGVVRAARSPGLVAMLWAANLLAVLPFAAVLADSIHKDVADRPVAHRLEAGFDADWMGEHGAAARGFEASFDPGIVGAGAFLRNLEAWWSGRLFTEPSGGWGLLAAGLAFALLWIFLLGGVLQRLAGPGTGVRGAEAGFAAACGRYFFRFLRLALLAAPLYLLVYWLSRTGFGALEEAMRDVTSERTALLWSAGGALATVLLLTLVKVIFDYGKIAVVVDGRGSALAAAWAGARFVASRPLATLVLYWSFALAALLLLWAYAAVAPQAGPGSWPGVVLALLLGQLALAARVGLRLAVLGGEIALYRGEDGGRGVGKPAGRPEAPAPAASPRNRDGEAGSAAEARR